MELLTGKSVIPLTQGSIASGCGLAPVRGLSGTGPHSSGERQAARQSLSHVCSRSPALASRLSSASDHQEVDS